MDNYLVSDCASSSSAETRRYERISLPLKGQLFDPGDETEIGCEVISLSGGGATLKSECEFPAGKHMVLYIEGFGRYEGTTVLLSGTPMLSFTIGELKRKRLTEMVHRFVSLVCRRSPICTSMRSRRPPSVAKSFEKMATGCPATFWIFRSTAPH
jgi:hypothetical protein